MEPPFRRHSSRSYRIPLRQQVSLLSRLFFGAFARQLLGPPMTEAPPTARCDLTNRWSDRRTVVRLTLEMASALSLRATRVLYRSNQGLGPGRVTGNCVCPPTQFSAGCKVRIR